MNLFDYDEQQCVSCGHIGILPDGDLDVECPVCNTKFSLLKDYEDKE